MARLCDKPGVPCTPWGCISIMAHFTLAHVPPVLRVVPAEPTTPMGAELLSCSLALLSPAANPPSSQAALPKENLLLDSHQIL